MGLLDTEPINPWCFMKLSIALYFGNFIHIFGIGSESMCLAGGLFLGPVVPFSSQAFFALELWKAKGHPLFLAIFGAASQGIKGPHAVHHSTVQDLLST